MTDLLFDLPESLSPKVVWLREHQLETKFMGTDWVCRTYSQALFARGKTEEEAILEYCEKHGLKHYSLP